MQGGASRAAVAKTHGGAKMQGGASRAAGAKTHGGARAEPGGRSVPTTAGSLPTDGPKVAQR